MFEKNYICGFSDGIFEEGNFTCGIFYGIVLQVTQYSVVFAQVYTMIRGTEQLTIGPVKPSERTVGESVNIFTTLAAGSPGSRFMT